MILDCLYANCVDQTFLVVHSQYRVGFVDALQVRAQLAMTEYGMPPGALDRAMGAGDDCLAIWDGETLAAYQWYSHTPHAFADRVTVHFDRRHVYLHHAFTHPSYRGRRLNGVGATHALEHYLERGYKGVVCYVGRDNPTSLKSFLRVGFRRAGTIVVFKIGRLLGLRHPRSPWLNEFVIWVSPGCRRLGLRMVRSWSANTTTQPRWHGGAGSPDVHA